MKTDESEKAKQELLDRLRKGQLDGIESVLDVLKSPGSALYFSFYKELNPEVVDKFYTVAINYYKGKKQYEHIATLCEHFQKKHRAKHQLELELK